jgi:hypothetical protein
MAFFYFIFIDLRFHTVLQYIYTGIMRVASGLLNEKGI